MSDPESGNTSLPERQMGISETPELGALEADVPNHIAPRPVTIEDVPEDERDSDSSVTMTPLQTESPPTSQATPLALVSSTGTPTTTGATMNSSRSEEEKLDDHRFQEPQWVSPRPQRRLGTNAHIAREHPPHHHPHQQNVHPLASHAEVSRYLDSMPPGGFSEPARRPLRRGQGPPSSVLSDRSSSLSPAVLRSPSLAPTHSAFPNDRFSPANNRPPWGPPEYWSEGDNPPPFQKLGSPTFPPGPGRSNNATGFPHGMPLGAPGGGGPKHFPPPSYAPPRTHPRSRQQPPPEFDQLHQPPPFAVPVHGLENGDMTGYKYLTAKLGGSLFGPPITPIYRRFEAMGHRITLQLQDELCQLEEELDGIDNFETTSRLAHGTLMPASTRAAALDDHPVAQQRLEVLSKISEKLDMYCAFPTIVANAL